ncbi:MAG: hypothetical protein ACO1QB_18465 [Verrucomicrobiales bacterium]
MDENDFKQLEQFIQRKLTTLPDRKAPADLAGSVFKQIARQQARWWWQRPFHFWPKPAQAFLHLLLVSSFMLFVYFGSVLMGHVSVSAASIVSQLGHFGSEFGDFVMAGGKICWAVLSRASLDTLALFASILAMAYFGCIGLGVALYKVAFKNVQTT